MNIFNKAKVKETLNISDFNKDNTIYEMAINWDDGERRLEQLFVDQSLIKVSDAPEFLRRALDKWADDAKTPLFIKKIYSREQVMETAKNRETYVLGFKYTYSPVLMGAIFDVFDGRAQFAMEVGLEKVTGLFDKVTSVTTDDLYRYLSSAHMVGKVPYHCGEKIRKTWEEIFKNHEKYVGKAPVVGEILGAKGGITGLNTRAIEEAIKSGDISKIIKVVGENFKDVLEHFQPLQAVKPETEATTVAEKTDPAMEKILTQLAKLENLVEENNAMREELESLRKAAAPVVVDDQQVPDLTLSGSPAEKKEPAKRSHHKARERGAATLPGHSKPIVKKPTVTSPMPISDETVADAAAALSEIGNIQK